MKRKSFVSGIGKKNCTGQLRKSLVSGTDRGNMYCTGAEKVLSTVAIEKMYTV